MLYLPAIFPYLVTGWVTAAGGAWNASIVAEYVTFRGEIAAGRSGSARDQRGRRARRLPDAGRQRARDVGPGRDLQPPRLAAPVRLAETRFSLSK